MPSDPPAPPGSPPAAPDPAAPGRGDSASGVALERNRLHPVSILFILGAQVRSMLFPAIFAIFAAGSVASWQVWSVPLVLVFGLGGVVRYFFFRYTYTPDQLVIESGMIFRKRRHIPYGRIHNIASVVNPLHRAFGVAEVRVETAGGEEPEAKIRVLSLDALDEMRRRVAAAKAASGVGVSDGAVAELSDADPLQPAARSARILVGLKPKDLLLHGLIDNRGLVVVGAVWGLLWQTGLFDRWEDNRFRLPSYGEALPVPGLLTIILLSVAGVVAFLVTVRLLSIAWAFYRLWNFELRLTGRELGTESGLVTRVTDNVPLHRVQVVSINESPLHQLFGYVEVIAETAGGNPSQGERSGKKRLAPILRREALPELLATVLPGVDLSEVDWNPVDPRGRRRMFKRWLAFILVAGAGVTWGAGLTWDAGPWAIAAVVAAIGWAWWLSGRRIRLFGWALSGDAVFYRSGALWRRTSIVFGSKIQAVAVGESPFDRRYDMAKLLLDTAGAGAASHRIHVPYLLRTTADALYATLGQRAAKTAFRW